MLFRETIRRTAEGYSRVVYQEKGKGHYAHLKVLVKPLPRGSGFELLPLQGSFVLPAFFPGIEHGFMSALASGVVAHYEVTDVRAEVIDGSYHEQDSSIPVFARAAEQAVRQALQNADPYLLEPVLNVSVGVPDEFIGTVIGELNSRRGRIVSVEKPKSPDSSIIVAAVPELERPGIEERLQYLTQGRATISFATGGYDELPASLFRQMRYCAVCERKVLPSAGMRCPDCGSELQSGGDFMNAV